MATLIVGDVHGCFNELCKLLNQAAFSPKQDTLWLTGDLVARGPDSLEVLRYVYSLGKAARIVLGNHDLHLLAIYAGIHHDKTKEHLMPLLNATDADKLINWLRCQPLLQVDEEQKLLMVHAGISPQWDINTAKNCANEVETMLRSDSYPRFLETMYGDLPNIWDSTLSGLPRLRFTTNALTRLRFCDPQGYLDMSCKESPTKAPASLRPWFEFPTSITSQYQIVFGHWASLNGQGTPKGFYPLDTGCCWGGSLTLLRWEDKTYFMQPSFQSPELLSNK